MMPYFSSITSKKANIIAQLQKDILPLQGFKRTLKPAAINALPYAITNAFPNAEFPLGAVHEFISTNAEEAACTGGFISGILGSIMRSSGASIWISSDKILFPPALKLFGV